MSGLLSAEELAMLRYGEPLLAARRVHNALIDHIDALTAELVNESRWREQDALRLAALAAENDALKRRLAAAEAGIAAKLVAARNQAENPAIDRGFRPFADGMVEGLKIAARIIDDPTGVDQ